MGKRGPVCHGDCCVFVFSVGGNVMVCDYMEIRDEMKCVHRDVTQ